MRVIHIREARERRGLTQVELAAAVGVTQATISKWERDPDVEPTYDDHVALARALEVDPARLRYGLREQVSA
jgi:transcriptional regulator with XRE-family HTH domain